MASTLPKPPLNFLAVEGRYSLRLDGLIIRLQVVKTKYRVMDPNPRRPAWEASAQKTTLTGFSPHHSYEPK